MAPARPSDPSSRYNDHRTSAPPIEGPDLHGRNAFGEQLGGQFVGPLQKAVEIVVAVLSRPAEPQLFIPASLASRMY